MIKWIRTSRLSIKNSLSLRASSEGEVRSCATSGLRRRALSWSMHVFFFWGGAREGGAGGEGRRHQPSQKDRTIDVYFEDPLEQTYGICLFWSHLQQELENENRGFGRGVRVGGRTSSVCSGSKAGSYLRLIDSCITQLKAQGPSRTCKKSKKEEEDLFGSADG